MVKIIIIVILGILIIVGLVCLFQKGATAITKQTVTLKGNIQITNKCNGNIVDTPLVAKIGYWDASGSVSLGTSTALAHFNGDYYVFRNVDTVIDANIKQVRIESVTGNSGSDVCSKVQCTNPSTPTCANVSPAPGKLVAPGANMLYDITCNCK